MKFHFSILFCLSFIFVLDFCVKANDLESVLSKYCISSLPGKGHCSTDREAHYESSKNRCRCGSENSSTYNYWDKSTRLCKSCGEGYIRNENTLSDCIKAQCPPGYGLEKVSKIECPSGNEVQYIHGGGSCGISDSGIVIPCATFVGQ